jgi:hypothetical protein
MSTMTTLTMNRPIGLTSAPLELHRAILPVVPLHFGVHELATAFWRGSAFCLAIIET